MGNTGTATKLRIVYAVRFVQLATPHEISPEDKGLRSQPDRHPYASQIFVDTHGQRHASQRSRMPRISLFPWPRYSRVMCVELSCGRYEAYGVAKKWSHVSSQRWANHYKFEFFSDAARVATPLWPGNQHTYRIVERSDYHSMSTKRLSPTSGIIRERPCTWDGRVPT